jgi:ComF family protein
MLPNQFYVSSPTSWGRSVLQVFYPRVCAGCERDLYGRDQHCFCMKCRLQLEQTDLHHAQDNPFTQRLWGRVSLYTGSAFYYFKKRTPIQRAIFRLKYGNRPDIGYALGHLYGEQLAQSPLYHDIRKVVAVPLHPAREQSRGYNQSQMFAQGLADGMRIETEVHNLCREVSTQTQTKRHRFERFENVQNAFGIRHPERIKNQHILLVDDVLTTGATLESCAQTLMQVPDVRVSMATIAMAALR